MGLCFVNLIISRVSKPLTEAVGLTQSGNGEQLGESVRKIRRFEFVVLVALLSWAFKARCLPASRFYHIHARARHRASSEEVPTL